MLLAFLARKQLLSETWLSPTSIEVWNFLLADDQHVFAALPGLVVQSTISTNIGLPVNVALDNDIKMGCCVGSTKQHKKLKG